MISGPPNNQTLAYIYINIYLSIPNLYLYLFKNVVLAIDPWARALPLSNIPSLQNIFKRDNDDGMVGKAEPSALQRG